jgi:GH24 family phage-related lysozyme (muramidase)
MKKLILLIMFVAFGVTAGATNHLSSLMNLPPFERSVRVVKFYETLHRNAGNVIGYGHVIQPGESYKPNTNLTEKQADALLRQDLAKLYKMFKSYGPAASLLATLAYNIGPGKVLRSNMLKKLESGDNDIYHDYVSFCCYQGRQHKGIKRRRLVEYRLLYK